MRGFEKVLRGLKKLNKDLRFNDFDVLIKPFKVLERLLVLAVYMTSTVGSSSGLLECSWGSLGAFWADMQWAKGPANLRLSFS